MVDSAYFPITNFFEIEEPNCPITSCELKEVMCLEFYDRKNIELTNDKPLRIKVFAG